MNVLLFSLVVLAMCLASYELGKENERGKWQEEIQSLKRRLEFVKKL